MSGTVFNGPSCPASTMCECYCCVGSNCPPAFAGQFANTCSQAQAACVSQFPTSCPNTQTTNGEVASFNSEAVSFSGTSGQCTQVGQNSVLVTCSGGQWTSSIFTSATCTGARIVASGTSGGCAGFTSQGIIEIVLIAAQQMFPARLTDYVVHRYHWFTELHCATEPTNSMQLCSRRNSIAYDAFSCRCCFDQNVRLHAVARIDLPYHPAIVANMQNKTIEINID